MQARERMFSRFMEIFSPDSETTILDVGVTNDTTQQESNYFEHLYPYPQRIVCVGTEDGSHLMQQYPGLKYQSVEAGKPLPFKDRQFDIVFSNAVLEHTGSREMQAKFLTEICRVGRQFFVTTPNRWFPVEHHTGLPFLHYLPARWFRSLVRHTSYRYWAEEHNLNILTARELRQILPVQGQVEAVRLLGIPSNLIAYGTN
jgi:SAM-dependent methyltransferase